MYVNVCRYAEMLVLLSFIVLALLWFLREPRFIPGWGDLFPQGENGNRWELKTEEDALAITYHLHNIYKLTGFSCFPLLNSPVLCQMVPLPSSSSFSCSSFHPFPVFRLHQPGGDHQTVSRTNTFGDTVAPLLQYYIPA